MAFTSHPQVEHMAAIVNVPNTAGVKKATVADALRRMRLTRADLDVQGCLLTLATRITRAEWVHSEGPPRPIADQQLWMQWERTTMEQDDESDHQESDTAEHAPVVPSERESGFTTYTTGLLKRGRGILRRTPDYYGLLCTIMEGKVQQGPVAGMLVLVGEFNGAWTRA